MQKIPNIVSKILILFVTVGPRMVKGWDKINALIFCRNPHDKCIYWFAFIYFVLYMGIAFFVVCTILIVSEFSIQMLCC